MPEMSTSGSMSGVWKRGMVRIVRHRQPKGSAPAMLNLNHRVTPRLCLQVLEVGPAGFSPRYFLCLLCILCLL